MNPGSAPNGGPATKPLIRRKKPAADPFFKGPKVKPVASRIPPAGRENGHPTPPLANGQPKSQTPPVRDRLRAPSPSLPAVPERERVSGFSDPRVTAEGIAYRDYRLVTTKKDLLDGLRYHILQLTGDKPTDIRNEADFPKPARLHRRDPRAPPPGHQEKKEEDQLDSKDGLNPAEREELNRRKEARQKEREANLAQIAPSQNAGKRINFKKKIQQVFRSDFTAEEKRRIQTNYEEKLPWHLEDFDNKHCFVGHHQQGSRGSNAALVYEPAVDASSGKFRLIPIEKVYQFKPKREDLQKMTIEEVEAAMKKGGSDPEWLIRSREARIQEQLRERAAKESKGLFSGASKTTAFAGRTGEEADLDFEEDFADDEEGDLFMDKDEDEKIAEKRIKEDQLQANFLDFKDLKEYDEAEEREKREAEARKKNFRDLRKALERRERNYNHGSDSEYESSVSQAPSPHQSYC
jgi:transcription initiation factor TFIIF subunit alpha